jgi:hypothetical protein
MKIFRHQLKFNQNMHYKYVNTCVLIKLNRLALLLLFVVIRNNRSVLKLF